jgi:hypothetical protein
MTDSDDQATEQTAPPAAHSTGSPAPVDRDHPIVRLTRWQTVLSVVSIFIAIVALYAALTESAAVRQQTAASVWPIVQLHIEDYDDGTQAGFSIALTNAGVGPARLRAFRLRIRGKPARSWAEALALVDSELAPGVSRSFVRNRVLRPDETVTLIATEVADLARRLQAAAADAESSVSFCYCSIFDDCWVSGSGVTIQTPRAVAACPDYGDEAFAN